jgi:MYXO-CTERM domain-containing protein
VLDKKTVWGGYVGQTYDVAATEYCYQLTYKSLVDGTTVEKERTCVPHGNAGATGVFPANAAQLREAVEACASPPEGFEQAWCSARAAYCGTHRSLCADDDTSACEGSGSGAGGSGGSGAGGGGDSPDDADGKQVIVGCSVSAGRGASSGWALSAIGLALSLASRARRRRDRR